MTLSGKTALITGSSAGLGLAVARSLASKGANVVLHGRETQGAGIAAAAALQDELGISARYVSADLSDPAEVGRCADEAASLTGGIDILVNNAVIRYFGPVESLALDHWNNALSVNVTAPFLLIGRCLPLMRRHGWGRIFNMSSIYGSRGTVNRADYVTTKTAMLGLTRAVALETAKDGITCNAICPGATLTPNVEQRIGTLMQERSLGANEARSAFLAGRVPMERFTEAAHVGDLVAFLSGPAGAGITGAMLPLDGGWLAS